jgi:hypothetical protein
MLISEAPVVANRERSSEDDHRQLQGLADRRISVFSAPPKPGEPEAFTVLRLALSRLEKLRRYESRLRARRDGIVKSLHLKQPSTHSF